MWNKQEAKELTWLAFFLAVVCGFWGAFFGPNTFGGPTITAYYLLLSWYWNEYSKRAKSLPGHFDYDWSERFA